MVTILKSVSFRGASIIRGEALIRGRCFFQYRHPKVRRLFEARLLLEEMLYIYLGQPLVKSHDGPGVTRSIINELNSWDIQEDQVEDGSFDGQYFHLSVPAHLTEALHLSDQFICTWDPLHKGGVVDNHIREDSSFSWLVEIQTICRETFSTFNWGKNYESFMQIYGDLNVQMKKLTNFQMTSVHFVFINLRISYSEVRLTLVNVKRTVVL